MNLKNIIMMLSIITTSPIHTMDEPMDIEEVKLVQQSPCYLAMLPEHVRNLIARYLTFDMESEEEFIERTKTTIKKEIPSKYYYKDFQLPSTLTEFIDNSRGIGSTLTAFCPNEMNVALLDANNLKIINIKKDQLLHTQDLEKKDYHHIALSRNATMFATINKHKKVEKVDNTPCFADQLRYFITNFLTIQNIATQKSETINFSARFGVARKKDSVPLAFNKQGTHIIVHGIDHTKTNNLSSAGIAEDPMPHHMIFPVIVNEHNAIPIKKTLQHYFQQRGICKEITTTQ